MGLCFLVASHYYTYLSVWFTGFEDELVRNGIAIAVLFIATLIVGAIVNFVIGQLVEKRGCQAPIGYWASVSVRCAVC